MEIMICLAVADGRSIGMIKARLCECGMAEKLVRLFKRRMFRISRDARTRDIRDVGRVERLVHFVNSL